MKETAVNGQVTNAARLLAPTLSVGEATVEQLQERVQSTIRVENPANIVTLDNEGILDTNPRAAVYLLPPDMTVLDTCRHMESLGAERIDALDLVVPVHDPPVGPDRGEVAAYCLRSDPALQVVLGIEARDLPRVSIGLAV